MTTNRSRRVAVMAVPVLALLALAPSVSAMVPETPGPPFNFTARAGHISTADGGSLLMWGYANGDGIMQYPGPNIVVTQGDLVTVVLTNQLPVPTSIVFPGQVEVAASGGTAGLLTQEAAPGETVTYTFTAAEAGTYHYHSGTRPDLQIEMGLVGAIVVRPQGAMGMHMAYPHMGAAFDREYLFLFTEIDPRIHDLVECGQMDEVDNADYFPVYWFINGRNAPDTMADNFAPWLPSQPYACMPMMHPGDRMLMRIISAGRDLHSFHTHGNNFTIIARDGRLLESAPGLGPDLAESNFTISVTPGGTADAIFTWTGEKLGWDIYGHQQDIDNEPLGDFPGPGDIDHNNDGIFDNVPMEDHEYAPDHGKPFPVVLPDVKDLTFGGMYSGSPFLGAMGFLPPGEGGMNPHAGFMYMWHSHLEKEMTNNDIFPGGLMTMPLVVPHHVEIMH